MANETDEKDIKEINCFNINKEPTQYKYSIILSDEVEHPSYKYAELCDILREEVKENDLVNIYISNYGGCCDAAATIVNAINNCAGEVTAIVTAPSYSAATMIALACDKLKLEKYSFLMFHNFSNVSAGKGGELKAGVVNTEKVIHGMMEDIYSPFLTKTELSAIFNDKDVYVHWNDSNLKERLNRHFGDEDE